MNDCCEPKGGETPQITANPFCPECGKKGKKVKEITPKSLLTAPARSRYEPGQYYFCSSRNCTVVYFHNKRFAVFKKEDVEVLVWQKDGAVNPDVPVCYCFGHTQASIRQDIENNGTSDTLESIKRHVKAGRCACEIKNPQGRCCLGNVMQILNFPLEERV